MFIDTHCHLDDKVFENKVAVVEEYLKENVNHVINVGCDIESSIIAKNLAEQFESIYFACGFHPSEVQKFNHNALQNLDDLSKHEKCVAIGEIGIDYHWEGYDKAKQHECFISQIELAYQNKLPLSIHLRDATEDALKILKQYKDKLIHGGVIHCFSGSVETAKEILNLGLYIGFGGTLTFKNANKLLEVAKATPIDKILTETDSPYLAPHPYRGSINTPKNIPLVCAKIAELKGLDIIETANAILSNAKALFKKLK